MSEEIHEMILRLKSGKEFHFFCKEYNISTLKMTGELAKCEFKGTTGECPLYFKVEDVESISIIE